MKLATGLAVLLALVLPGVAGAVTIESPNPAYQRWANTAKMPTPTTSVTVIEGSLGPCEGRILAGCAARDGSTIWLQNPSDQYTFFHELGHVFDALVLPEWARARFAVLYGTGIRPWQSNVEERFAETYMDCAIKARWRANRHANPRLRHAVQQHNVACRMIRTVGGENPIKLAPAHE